MFKDINQMITLVPALLGLKGNLEMTLAARLSTQVNAHDTKLTCMKEKWRAFAGNTALVQTQSIVVGFLASIVACIVDLIKNGHFEAEHLLTLITTSMSTAVLASLMLGT